MQETIGIILVSSLLSGLIGVFISIIFYTRLERKRIKVDTAKRLIGNRYFLKGDAFTIALNECLVVFSDNKDIIKTINELYKTASTKGLLSNEDTLLNLFKLVSKDAGIYPKEINDTAFLTAFNTKN